MGDLAARQAILNRISIEDRGHSSPCWVWTGPVNHRGYGRTSIPGFGPRARIHRVMYEIYVGPIPDGLQIDHLCRVKPCCNPAHLEAVTAEENIRRAIPYFVYNGCGIRSRSTHCADCGLLLSDENRAPNGGRCKPCRREYERQWRLNNREKIRGYDAKRRRGKKAPANGAGGTERLDAGTFVTQQVGDASINSRPLGSDL